jgi:hypothetical protein
MSELEEIRVHFDQLQKDRPSTIRTTFFYGPIGWICQFIGWLFFIIGVGLIIATIMGSFLFSIPDTDERISDMPEAYQQLVMGIQAVTSIASLIIGMTLLFIGGLCRKITTRNSYILQLEQLFESQNEKKP